MGHEFHRLVMAALAAGLLVIPGCGAGDGTNTPSTTQTPPATTQSAAQPKIIAASIEGTSTLRVTFSEEMKAPTGVDPAKFRLTVAYFTRPASASEKYSYAYYSNNAYGYGGPNNTIYSETAAITSILVDPTVAEQAVLQLGAGFDAAAACKQITTRNLANPNAQAGLYLHYLEAGTPTIEDVDGNKLGSLAAYWSADPTVEQISGDFLGKPIPVNITCTADRATTPRVGPAL
jgi:hypothetical protein